MPNQESILQKAVLDLMGHIEDVYCVRVGSGLIQTKQGRWFKTGKRGCPDLICSIFGKFYGLEVKVGKNKLSPFQKKAKGDIEKTGGKYLVIRSLEDIENLLTSEFDKYSPKKLK